jgi:Ca2+/Na+ antiporter
VWTHSTPFDWFFFSLFFVFQVSMEPKEQEQQAPLLVVGVMPAHGMMWMELFGSLVVMDMTALVLMVSVLIFFFLRFRKLEEINNQKTQTELNEVEKQQQDISMTCGSMVL